MGSTAIITGAGSGIGRALALQLAAADWQVALVGRTRSKLEDTAEKCAKPQAALVVDVDLTDPDAAQRIVDRTVDHFGRVNALAHVAGDAPLMPIDEMSPQTIRRCLITNTAAAAELTAAVWPHMKEAGGVIAQVSSMASFDPFPGFAVYAAAKVGINMLTQATAGEGKPHNIRTVCIAPGAVETPMLRGLFDEKMLPREKTLSPDEVAQVMYECITGARSFISGETIKVESP